MSYRKENVLWWYKKPNQFEVLQSPPLRVQLLHYTNTFIPMMWARITSHSSWYNSEITCNAPTPTVCKRPHLLWSSITTFIECNFFVIPRLLTRRCKLTLLHTCLGTTLKSIVTSRLPPSVSAHTFFGLVGPTFVLRLMDYAGKLESISPWEFSPCFVLTWTILKINSQEVIHF